MKGDFSKDTFRKKKHFHDVHMQQGRVLLDSDWNEQADINEHRVETGTLDIVGETGAPYHYAGFDIVTVDAGGKEVIPPAAGTNMKISEGRFYVNGIMCENEESVLFINQPDFDKTELPKVPGRYIFYLDVWQRHITALEDEELREVALGGPDTTTRNKTVWQVKCEPVKPGTNCADPLPKKITEAPSGRLMARTELPTGTEDPCGLAVSGGYRRLENQLYRVEIHKGGANRAATTFKWSRDNGSVIVKWESVDVSNANNFIVSSTGRDELLGFKSGDWIEMIDDRTDLLGLTGPIVQLSKVDGNVLTVNPATNIPGNVAVTAGAKNARIRRWDSAGELKPNTNNIDWIELEDGVQVQFKEGSFRTGDYWLIPARTAIADIEWPYIDHQLPQGIQHHYAKLGIADLTIGAAPAWVKIGDCRPIFPPLTELITLNYVGGDGQEAMPGAFLDEFLQVAVSNGQWPVKDAIVRFKIDSGGGTLGLANASSVTALTDKDGIAICKWKLGAEKFPLENQRVIVNLLDAGGKILHLPVIFSAKLTPRVLFYVSGDGQQASAGKELPAPVKVGVAYEQFPAVGVKVRFDIASGSGGVIKDSSGNVSSLVVTTDVNGIAECKPWQLGSDTSKLQQLTATLLDLALPPLIPKATHIPITFTAGFSDDDKCCSMTVGKDGDFESLEIALKALSNDKIKDVCICLLPPVNSKEHIATDFALVGKSSIKITGCGATIRLFGEKFYLDAEVVTVSGVDFMKADEIKSEINFSANEVNVDSCKFGHEKVNAVGDNPVAVFIITPETSRAVTTLHWNNNAMGAGYSFAIPGTVRGWIGSNIIAGELLLQYDRKFFDLTWDFLEESQRKTIEGKLTTTLGIKNRNEVLQIHKNMLNRVRTNTGNKINIPQDLLTGQNKIISGYNNLIVSENIFRGLPNSFVAESFSLINNHFMAPDDATPLFALGYSGVLMGNISPHTNGAMETLFQAGRKIKAPNLCNIN